MPAQGNALGWRGIGPVSPEGARRPAAVRLLRPFRAVQIQIVHPRALPWADMFGPFGAKTVASSEESRKASAVARKTEALTPRFRLDDTKSKQIFFSVGRAAAVFRTVP
jgi:hypothetical protein